MEGVTVYGHVPECHERLGDGDFILFDASEETISNVPRYTPVREAYGSCE